MTDAEKHIKSITPKVIYLWKRGFDTLAIAKHLKTNEAIAYNILARRKRNDQV